MRESAESAKVRLGLVWSETGAVRNARPSRGQAASTRVQETCLRIFVYTDAGEKQTRVRLAVAINLIIEARHLSQAAAARLLDMNQDSQRKIRHQRHKNQQNVRGKVRDNHGVDEAEARSKARRQ